MLSLVLVATCGQYFPTLVHCAFPNKCFARYVSCSLEIFSDLLLVAKNKIDVPVENIVALSCWLKILVWSNDSSCHSLSSWLSSRNIASCGHRYFSSSASWKVHGRRSLSCLHRRSRKSWSASLSCVPHPHSPHTVWCIIGKNCGKVVLSVSAVRINSARNLYSRFSSTLLRSSPKVSYFPFYEKCVFLGESAHFDYRLYSLSDGNVVLSSGIPVGGEAYIHSKRQENIDSTTSVIEKITKTFSQSKKGYSYFSKSYQVKFNSLVTPSISRNLSWCVFDVKYPLQLCRPPLQIQLH